MVKFSWPPAPDQLRRVPAQLYTLRTGTNISRIYARGGAQPSTWRTFREAGPLPTARFDHHAPGERRAVLYGARYLTTCVAEVFQGTRLVDRVADDRWFAAFPVMRPVRLLDLAGNWPTRAGASQAIASGPRPRAQAWARAIYDAYPKADGIWYPSSMHGGHAALVLFERARAALPEEPSLDIPLSHPGLLPDLIQAAESLGYLLR